MFFKTKGTGKRGRKRGFVGPLGDDIPSIFPIVAGVLLFIGTLVYAFGLVQEKNQYLEISRAALTLSYIMTEKGVMQSATDFEAKCSLVKKTADTNRVRVLVTIKRYCDSVELYQGGPGKKQELNPLYLEKFELEAQGSNNGRTWDYCTNAENAEENSVFPQPKNAVLLSYPIAVPCPAAGDATRGVGLINIMVWR